MRIPLSWLRELVPTDLPAEDLAELIDRRGVKIEGVLRPWEGLDGVQVAQVLEVRDHPDSSKLCLARIRHRDGETELVVGVRNMAAGDLVPWAGPGARVPLLPEPLGAREIRGVVSNGMLCSPGELALSQDHGGILQLNDEGLEVGADLKSSLGLDDAVLDIEVEPNRPDFLSILGVAREAAAATGATMIEPDATVSEAAERAEQVATVSLEAPERCPRYVARVIRGIGVGHTPLRIQARLTACGVRPISPVVDATNHTMLELGQPLHAFDMDRLGGPGIVVRPAVDGERLTTLDDVERVLEPSDLLICDLERPVAIAGIMGGASAEVSDTTRHVLLESAWFTRSGILLSARRLDLHTEASHRFERGTDPEGLERAAARCAAWIAAWTGGAVSAGVAAAGSEPERRWVSMRPARATAVLGYPVGAGDAARVFDELGMDRRAGDDSIEVQVPGYRVDIEEEVDLIEEVVRVQGYDKVGSSLPRAPQAGGLPAPYAVARRAKDVLVRAGLRELRPVPFASQGDLALMGDDDAVAIANPLRTEEGSLRTRLTPGLLRAVARDQAAGVRSSALFEVGTVFRLADPVQERRKIAFALAGAAAQGWPADGRPLDVSDARGVLEALMEEMGVSGWALGDPPGGPLHPGRAAWVEIGGERAGVLGEVHPGVAGSLDIEGRVAICELEFDAVAEDASKELAYRDVPRFPPLRRDLAFVLADEVPAGDVRAALEDAAGDLLGSALLFDVFRGPPLADGTKSLAFTVEFRAEDRTLTDDETRPVVDRIVARLAEELGAELRTA